jgi:hypothetical protein
VYVPPPPLMVLNSKLEVCEGYRDKRSHNDEDDEDNEQYAIDSINFVTPHTCKNVVELNVDCTERQESSHAHLKANKNLKLCQMHITTFIKGMH